jgi:metal-sulfur cluster biosynthetic enzyme
VERRRGGGVNERDVRAELDRIVDPCSAVAGAPAGIVELGLVRSLSVVETTGGVSVAVRIGVTEPGCMMGASFVVRARERLEALPDVVAVDVRLDHSGDWEPADIDPAYAERLATVRARRAEGVAQARVRSSPSSRRA